MSVAMHVGMFAFSSIGEITMCTVQVMWCKTVAWESTKAEVMQHRSFTGSFREHCSLRFVLFVNRSRLCGKHVLVNPIEHWVNLASKIVYTVKSDDTIW